MIKGLFTYDVSLDHKKSEICLPPTPLNQQKSYFAKLAPLSSTFAICEQFLIYYY